MFRIAGLADDTHARLTLEQSSISLAHDGVIVYEKNPDWVRHG
jgi:hypothetical protein